MKSIARKKISKHGLFLIITACIIPSTAAFGEEKDSVQLDSMTVTAEKREEKVQDVPIAISVFDDVSIEDAGIKNMTDLSNFTPNMYASQNGPQNTMNIRGVSSFNGSTHSPSGLFVDGVSYPLSMMQKIDLIDIERIEVLRGPQGTLYGRNTESGVINVYTKQPGNELRGKVWGNVGIYDVPHDEVPFYQIGGAVSGPIVEDRLFMGLSFQGDQSDGYFNNSYNDDDSIGETDHKYVQAMARWTPTDQLNISLIANASHNEDFYGAQYISGTYATDPYTVNWNDSGSWEEKVNTQILKVEYEHELFDIVSITSRNEFESDAIYDLDFSPANFGSMEGLNNTTMVSQDFRILSPDNSGSLKWLVGLYGFKEDSDNTSEYFGVSRNTDYENTGVATYGQGTYTVADKLHLTAGLRYEYQETEGTQLNSSASEPFSKDTDYEEILPKLAASYDLKDNIMIYTSVAQGFLVGGYNSSVSLSEEDFSYDPEYTWNYEVGLKTSWFNKKLIMDLAAFYIDMEDKQIMQYAPEGGAWFVSNAAEASSTGFEISFEARPAQGLQFFGGLGITDSKIGDWVSDSLAGNTIDYKDNKLAMVPNYTYNLGFKYSHYSGMFVRADLIGVGERYYDPENNSEMDSYTLTNLSVGYQGENYDITLRGENVIEEEYLTQSTTIGTSTFAQYGPPRTVSLNLTYRF